MDSVEGSFRREVHVVTDKDSRLQEILCEASSHEERMDLGLRWLDANLRVDPEMAGFLIEELRKEADLKGNKEASAWLRFHKGWLFVDVNDYEQGYAELETVRRDFELLGDKAGLARSMNGLATSKMYQCMYDEAIDLYREALQIAIEISRFDIAGAAGNNLAGCLLECNEEKEALEILKHCRRHYLTAPHNVIALCGQEGETHRRLGQLEEAERILLEGLRLGDGSPNLTLELRFVLAETYLDGECPAKAAPLVEAGLLDAFELSSWKSWTSFKLSEARLLLQKKELDKGISSAKAAIEKAREQGARKDEAAGEHLLYQGLLAKGQHKEALEALVRHSTMMDALRHDQTTRRIVSLNSERVRREALHFEKLYKQVSAISEIGQRIASSLDLETSFDLIHRTICELMDAPTILIALVDEKRQCLDYRYVLEDGMRYESFTKDLTEQNFGCWCVRNQKDVVMGDVASERDRYGVKDRRLANEKGAQASLVYVPLFLGARVVGVLSVQSKAMHSYDPQKVEILRAVGSYIAILLENSRLFQEIEHLAITDSLTGLPNRRRLMEELEKTFHTTKESRLSSGIIAVDVDHFKVVNDTFGHDGGDKALIALSDCVSLQVGHHGLVGRFGGEEFVIILPGFGGEETSEMAERLRSAVEALALPLPEGIVKLTASFGVSVFCPSDLDSQDAIKRADKALYKAKGEGRNRVCELFLGS